MSLRTDVVVDDRLANMSTAVMPEIAVARLSAGYERLRRATSAISPWF